MTAAVERVRAAVAAVPDPELPALTIADLGILRDVSRDGDTVVVTITPTYLGCPALHVIRADVAAAARAVGAGDVEVVTTLHPPWTSDRITAAGREKLAACGVAPPGPAPAAPAGRRPLPLLMAPSPPARCPLCGSGDVAEITRFGATACTALWRCRSCGEPFDRMKEHR